VEKLLAVERGNGAVTSARKRLTEEVHVDPRLASVDAMIAEGASGAGDDDVDDGVSGL
jgi:hypothetical protein